MPLLDSDLVDRIDQELLREQAADRSWARFLERMEEINEGRERWHRFRYPHLTPRIQTLEENFFNEEI